MPFKSEKQRRYMFKKHPEIARRWAAEGKGYVEKSADGDGERSLFLDMGGAQVSETPKRDLPVRDVQTGRFVAVPGAYKHSQSKVALIFEKE